MHSADFLLFEEKNPENLSHFSDFHGSKVKGFDEADIEPPPIPPSFTKVVFELRERHGFFVHFQAVLFPEVRFSFIFRCSIETPFTMTAEMLSGEPEPAVPGSAKNISECDNSSSPISNWQIILPLLHRGRFSVPDISGVLHKPKHRQDREGVLYE